MDKQSDQALADEMTKLWARLHADSADTEVFRDSEVMDHGQIKYMDVPGGWTAGPVRSFQGGIGTRSLLAMHPDGEPDVKLCIYYRGLPVGEDAGKTFHAILQREPHDLTAVEFASIGEILRDKRSVADFEVKSATTSNVNGKRVLVVEGTYKQIQEEVREYFVDADDTGQAVQEIFYQAPAAKFKRYETEADSALNSIEWKQSNR